MAGNKLLKRSKYKVMPWKNGGGTTAEIEIYPKTSSVDKLNFLWRLSSATITQPGPFSKFEGYERLLAVVEGAGLKLNLQELTALVPHRWSGDQDVFCEPLGGEVVDLGLIFKKDKVKADMMVHSFWNRHKLTLDEHLHFFYCAEGSFSVDQQKLDVGDTLRVEGPEEIWFECAVPSLCFQIVIRF